jgi:hypothetical protein
MQQWRKSFPADIQKFYAMKRKERSADRRRYGEFIEQELKNPNSPKNFDRDQLG